MLGRKLADGEHEPNAAELAKTRVIIGTCNLFEPIEELQLEAGGQLKRQTQKAARLLEFGTAGGVMQAEMTDAHKAIREDMREKAADELHRGEGHQFFFAVVTVIEILESDSIFPNSNKAMIGDGNAEDVATEILDQLVDAVERGLDIDFPIFRQGLCQHWSDIECAVVGIQFAIRPKLRERKAETIAELIGKQFDGKEELVRSGLPTIASGGGHKGAACDDEVEVEMLLHGLTPGMQDHRKTDFTAEIFLSKLLQQLRGNFNQQVVEPFLIEGNQGVEDVVDGEDDVIIINGQNPKFLGFEPLRLFKRTAQRTMAVLAGFEMELPTFAFGASLQNAAQSGRAAIDNRADRLMLLIGKTISAFVFANMLSENLSHIMLDPLAVGVCIFYKSISL